ncbi:uncharacterized protein BJ171DRAFT_427644 [Polychytrium aggregatum]|uniref:uncharacterized protein n=1 Tax=Polychytrium aggregatum TaxID=110093 RepID=UPI0022FDDA2A|nr:uncharacterized protein BJ171DRAFT_427644 [Polychytrium aggregatum]KAI9199422.1 hypothetical protein BJ171DRAFT_427644 [Polychytrium aggregatum]
MRTVYLGNLPMPITYEEILNHVKTGAVEHVRILEDKQCVFVTFVEPMSAMQFHNDAIQKRLCLLGQEVKVGWGKPSPIPTNILTATQNGASRNVYIGNIDESVTDQYLQSEFSKFGPVDQIRVLLEKRIAFVHMTSIAAAIKVVTSLSQDPSWSGRRVNYGKDRCIPNKQMNPAAVSSALGGASGMMFQSGFPSQFGGMLSSGYPYDPHYVGGGNRTVYLGGIHQDATTKDLCDVIRGGILQNIKYLPDKNIAFVTFISPTAAYNFHNRGTYEGIVIKGKRVKIGWGKAVPIPANVAAAAQSGASRNVYIGAIDETITEEKLRKDFAEFGDIELVNIIQDKNIGFVNFTDILAAVKAVESLKISPEYSRFKINYGKDRCGNEPRPPRVNPSAAHGSHSHGGPAGPSNVISPATEFRANGGANAGASGALSPYATDNGIGGVEGYQISDHGSPTQFI